MAYLQTFFLSARRRALAASAIRLRPVGLMLWRRGAAVCWRAAATADDLIKLSLQPLDLFLDGDGFFQFGGRHVQKTSFHILSQRRVARH